MKKETLLALLETLKFHEELGVDAVVANTPNRKADFGENHTLVGAVQKLIAPTAVEATHTKVSSEIPKTVVASPKLSMDKTTVERVKGATTLEELRQIIENFEDCPLKHTATHTVFSDGDPSAPVMMIGEAPGAEEDKQGKPFVGLSGQLLDRILLTIGLERQTNVYISNIVSWRPPGNRAPTNQEIALCLPFIQRHIELVRPRVIVLLGATATKSVLNTSEGIMKIRGQWFDFKTPYTGHTAKTMATFHPAFLLRSPGQKKLVWQDFLKIKAELQKNS
jgi:uracil-DNA glycosylase